MMKNSRFKTAVSLVAFLLIVALATSLIYETYRKNYWKNQAGEYNLVHWNTLFSVVEQMDHSDYTVESIRENYPFINTLIYNSYSPNILGTDCFNPFLGIYYDPFVQKIASGTFSKKQQQEAMVLLETMNKEFLLLMDIIVDVDAQGKMDLVDATSKRYVQTQQKINAFCDKYMEQLAPYINR